LFKPSAFLHSKFFRFGGDFLVHCVFLSASFLCDGSSYTGVLKSELRRLNVVGYIMFSEEEPYPGPYQSHKELSNNPSRPDNILNRRHADGHES
jgi:hypothetical protein